MAAPGFDRDHVGMPSQTKEIPLAMAGFAARLAKAMAAREMWQGTKLADASGVDQSTISNMVLTGRGEAPKPRDSPSKLVGIRASTVLKLADALGVHIDWLLAGRGPRDVGDVPRVLVEAGTSDEQLRELGLEPKPTKKSGRAPRGKKRAPNKGR